MRSRRAYPAVLDSNRSAPKCCWPGRRGGRASHARRARRRASALRHDSWRDPCRGSAGCRAAADEDRRDGGGGAATEAGRHTAPRPAACRRRARFPLLFSSINSEFGWPGTGDYSSAKAFADAFAQSGLARSTRHVVAIGWAPWADTGMAHRSAAAGDAAARTVFEHAAIGLTDGMDALERVLASGFPHVYVSPRPWRI